MLTFIGHIVIVVQDLKITEQTVIAWNSIVGRLNSRSCL